MRPRTSLAIIFGLFLFITVLHYSGRHFLSETIFWQGFLLNFLFLPILLAGFWWGIRGGLLLGFLSATVALADLFVLEGARAGFVYQRWTQMFLFVAVGGLLGGLVDAERQAKLGKSTSITRVKTFFRRSILDPLTHCCNRNYMNKMLKIYWTHARRDGESFSLLMVDLNHFKSLNERHGLSAGDRVLKSTVQTIYNQTRKSDFVFRYGGDEFLVLLPGCPRQVALSLAKRLRREMAKVTFSDKPGAFKADFSVGVIEYDPEFKDISEMLSKLDQALYRAKQDKSRVALAS